MRVYPRTMGDSTLGVYTGEAVDALTEVDSNDDSFGLASQVTIDAESGVTYRIRVDSYSASAAGTFVLEIGAGCSAPGNDNFSNATVLDSSIASGSSTGHTNEAATQQGGEPDNRDICVGYDANNNYECVGTNDLGGVSIWYTWTAPDPAPSQVRFCIVNASATPHWKPVLGVWTGSLGALTEVGHSAETPGFGECDRRVEVVSPTPGTTYRIGVGGVDGTTGYDFELRWGQDVDGVVFDAFGVNVKGPSVTVYFAASEPSGIDRYECKVGSGAYVSCSSPWTPQLPKGTYTLRVKAVAVNGKEATKSVNVSVRSGKYKTIVTSIVTSAAARADRPAKG
jgi:hypothetical protein